MRDQRIVMIRNCQQRIALEQGYWAATVNLITANQILTAAVARPEKPLDGLVTRVQLARQDAARARVAVAQHRRNHGC